MTTNDESKLLEKVLSEAKDQLGQTMPSLADDDLLALTFEDANFQMYVLELDDVIRVMESALKKIEAEARSSERAKINHIIKILSMGSRGSGDNWADFAVELEKRLADNKVD